MNVEMYECDYHKSTMFLAYTFVIFLSEISIKIGFGISNMNSINEIINPV